jgi:hypothetical protein
MVILTYFSNTFINIFVIFPYIAKVWVRFMVFNATFNNISAISWRKAEKVTDKGVGMIRAEIGLTNRQIINETYSFRFFLIL